MRLQGKILNWNDDKGFGFVEPNGGGERVFVHISAFKPRSRRPVNGEVIIYEVVCGNNNRNKAENIKFARDSKNSNKKISGNTFGSVFIIIFCIGLLVSIFIGFLPVGVIGLYVAMSLITFVVYGIDKSAAKKARWRTRESTLHMFSLIGGWPGAFLAQKELRHKSRKSEFQIVFWITVLLNLGGLFWLHSKSAENFFNNLIMPLLGS